MIKIEEDAKYVIYNKYYYDRLKDVVKCDYNKDIDVKYNSMLFPESKNTFVNSLK